MKKRPSFLQQLAKLFSVLIVLLAIAFSNNRKMMGHDYSIRAESNDADTATVTLIGDSAIIVNTTRLCQDVTGYVGNTPLRLYVCQGVIDSIVSLPNEETPDFYECVAEELIPAYVGRSVADAQTAKVDVVTGATFSSKAVQTNISRALSVLPESYKSPVVVTDQSAFDLKFWATLLVCLSAALLPLLIKNKTYRLVQLVLNVSVLGIYTGTFVSYTSLVSVATNGFSYTMLCVIMLMAVALFYPLFGKHGYYCAWCCPLGSAQELVSRYSKWKVNLSLPFLNVLNIFRRSLWVVLMLLSLSGVCMDWMNYEMFSSFLWQSASYIVIAATLLTLFLSVFVNRPYCRFVCPTGTMLKLL